MPGKLKFEDIREYIQSQGDELLSDSYKNNKTLLSIGCCYCGMIYSQNFDRYKKGHRHQSCPQTILKIPNGQREVTMVEKTCPHCLNTFDRPKAAPRTYCSKACAAQANEVRAQTGFFQQCGREGGKKSASIEVRRSKNEIRFAELCASRFEILTNEPMFDGWDADVIIPCLRIAVRWNGIWHYRQVRRNHNLKQVQARDAIKEKVITSHGYSVYTIKDMGSAHKSFVEEQFARFMNYVYFI